MIEGRYHLHLKTPLGEQEGTLTLTLHGTHLEGSLANAKGQTPIEATTWQENSFSFTVKVPTPLGKIPCSVQGTIQGDELIGQAKLGFTSFPIHGVRIQ